jgi:hypothetical protein
MVIRKKSSRKSYDTRVNRNNREFDDDDDDDQLVDLNNCYSLLSAVIDSVRGRLN